MHVRLQFRTDQTGTATLVLPVEYAGEKLHALSNLRTISEGESLSDGPDESTKTLHAHAYRPVVITYDLKKDWIGPLVAPLQFHAVLLPDYFEFTGSNALVRPKLPDGAIETANFDWRSLPAKWALATSFGSSASTDHRCQTPTGPWNDVEGGLFAAGDYRLHDFQIAGRPAVLAIRGIWTFTDEHAIEQIQRVIGTVRDFWRDNDFLYFLVTLKPYDQDHGSSDGSEFTNSFWMYISRLDSIDNLLPQLAHESFHAWNPKKMGTLSSQSYEDLKWFKEGFTEYYAQLLTYEAAEQPISSYVDSVNRDLRRFPTSNDEYVRGRVIALWLDDKIRQDSHGNHTLDDFMFDMVRDRARPLTLTRFFLTASRYLSPESLTTLEAAGSNHSDLPAPSQLPLIGGCAQVMHQELPAYDLGFDIAQSEAMHRVNGVDQNGPAFAAGLRDGQPLTGFSFYKDNPDKMVRSKIHEDGKDRQITYYPRGQALLICQYRLDENVPCETLHTAHPQQSPLLY